MLNKVICSKPAHSRISVWLAVRFPYLLPQARGHCNARYNGHCLLLRFRNLIFACVNILIIACYWKLVHFVTAISSNFSTFPTPIDSYQPLQQDFFTVISLSQWSCSKKNRKFLAKNIKTKTLRRCKCEYDTLVTYLWERGGCARLLLPLAPLQRFSTWLIASRIIKRFRLHESSHWEKNRLEACLISYICVPTTEKCHGFSLFMTSFVNIFTCQFIINSL